jgi:anion-transporting  ArsA/GET3 family ATPase
MTAQLHDLRFIVVVGKGGVGKSATSAALAISLARQGRRVLIAMCNAKERLSYLMRSAAIGPQIGSIAPGIDAVNMEPGAALEEYAMMVLKVRALYKLIFENRLVSAFLRGTPGIEAWAMLGKAQYHAFELLPDRRPRYDTVIVDAPATGHGLELLRVPKVIMEVAPPGMLRRDADRAWRLFTDPKRAGILIVTTPCCSRQSRRPRSSTCKNACPRARRSEASNERAEHERCANEHRPSTSRGSHTRFPPRTTSCRCSSHLICAATRSTR